MDKQIHIKASVLASFIFALVVNALANILPFNGIDTGQVSNLYINLFTPASYTFAIWGLIYGFLAIYVLSVLGIINKKERHLSDWHLKIAWLFVFSNLANGLWMIAWHYQFLLVSVILMMVILLSLLLIRFEVHKHILTDHEVFCIRNPFSIYLGWITVATVANITAFLVSIQWSQWGIGEEIWFIAILLVATIIGLATMDHFKDVLYGFVLMWSYMGIVIKHWSPDGFAGVYTYGKWAVLVFFVLLTIATLRILLQKRQQAVGQETKVDNHQ